MAWPIRFIESPALHGRDPESGSVYYDGTVDFDKMEIGDLCYYHYQGRPCLDQAHLARLHLTAHYRQFNVGRPPLILALPDYAYPPKGKLYFLVDGQCYSNVCVKCGKNSCLNTCVATGGCQPKGYYDGWTVGGSPPCITVAPSVDYDEKDPQRKHYHGFIQNGIIGDG